MRHALASLLLAATATTALAGPTPAPVRSEIDALLARLQASRCEFNRNGTWYGADEARAHLLRKLDAIEGRQTLRSTEEFIDAAASASSASGKPYQVKCGNAAPVQSRQWLTRELATVRAAAR